MDEWMWTNSSSVKKSHSDSVFTFGKSSSRTCGHTDKGGKVGDRKRLDTLCIIVDIIIMLLLLIRPIIREMKLMHT